jgi:2-C-methyl-D-erythritol 4-phosphate cytidylyltransferase
MTTFAVILPAAGKALRFAGSKNKLLYDLRGETVLHRSIRAFLDRSDVAQVVLPMSDETMAAHVAEAHTDKRICSATGGASRAESVRNALRAVRSDIEWVAVHDAARPLISRGLVDATLAAAMEFGAAAPALAVSLTIKEARGPLPAKVQRTVPRQNLWAMQTPQIARRRDLLDAFERCPIPLEDVTDDVQLLELSGKDVYLVPGDERNLKITTQMDLHIAELLLASKHPTLEPKP